MPYTMEQMQELVRQKAAAPATQPAQPIQAQPQQPMQSLGQKPSGPLTMQQMQGAATRSEPLPDGMPQIKTTQDTSPMGWFKDHPWITGASAVFGPLGPATAYATAHPLETAGMAADMVKSIPSLGVQLPKSIAGSALQIPEDVRSYVTQTPAQTEGTLLGEAKGLGQEIMQPTNLPIVGEIKTPSAAPVDIEVSNTQTPLETGMQALDVALSGPSAVGAKTTVRGVTKALAKRTQQKTEKLFLDYIAPKLTRAEKEAMLVKSRSKKLVKASSEKSAAIAELARGVIDPKAPAAQNIANVGDKIGQVSRTVEEYLKTNVKPFNKKTFASYIRKTPVPVTFKSDKVMQGTYENVVRMAEDIASQFGGTRLDAWKGRIEFDRRVAEAFGEKALQANPQILTPAKQAIRDVRGKWNEFIAKDMPDKTFQKGMKDLSQLMELSEDLAYKYADEVGQLPETFLQKHPYIKKAAILAGKSLLGGTAIGLGFKNAADLIPGD